MTIRTLIPGTRRGFTAELAAAQAGNTAEGLASRARLVADLEARREQDRVEQEAAATTPCPCCGQGMTKPATADAWRRFLAWEARERAKEMDLPVS